MSSFGFADFALVFAFFGSVSIIVGFICAKPIFLQALCLDASEENIYPRIFVLLIAIVIAVFFVTQKVFA